MRVIYTKHTINAHGWSEWYHPMRSYRIRCCDCRLVHDIEFRVHKGRIWMRVKRNERSTAASRRKK